MSRPLAVALVQVAGHAADTAAARSQATAAARAAVAQGADLVVLPELVVPGYTLDPGILRAAAEPVPGPTTNAWREVAAETGATVVGGLCEAAGDRLHNTAVAVGPDGVVLHYRKLHLFAEEKQVFTPGDLGLPVATLPWGRLGLCVCYDLRFVEVARVLALRGAEVIAVPTAWIGGFDASPVPPGGLCRQAEGAVVQANLNQVYLACASQAGRAADLRFLGNSLVADPYGEPVRPPLDDTEADTVLAPVDLDLVAAAQRRGPLITPRQDRRTDVYGVRYGDQVL